MSRNGGWRRLQGALHPLHLMVANKAVSYLKLGGTLFTPIRTIISYQGIQDRGVEILGYVRQIVRDQFGHRPIFRWRNFHTFHQTKTLGKATAESLGFGLEYLKMPFTIKKQIIMTPGTSQRHHQSIRVQIRPVLQVDRVVKIVTKRVHHLCDPSHQDHLFLAMTLSWVAI